MTITVKLVLATCMTNTVNQHHTHKNDVGAPAAFTHITPNSTPPLLQEEQFLEETLEPWHRPVCTVKINLAQNPAPTWNAGTSLYEWQRDVVALPLIEEQDHITE